MRHHLEYASPAWDSSNQTNSQRLDRIQRQAARFCKNEYSREEGTVTRITEELQWEPLETRRKLKKLTLFYKIKHGLIDIAENEHLVPQVISNKGHDQKYRQIRYRINRYGETFFPSTIPIWNHLSSSIINSPSLDSFKEQLSINHKTIKYKFN